MSKQLYIIFLTLLFWYFSNGQTNCDEKLISKLDKKYTKAEKKGRTLGIKYADDAFNIAECFRSKNDTNALKWYNRNVTSIKVDTRCNMPDGVRYLKQAGISLYYLGNYKLSENYLQKIIATNQDPESFYYLAKDLIKLKKYSEAIVELNNFKLKSSDKKDADELILKSNDKLPCFIKGCVFSEAVGIDPKRPVNKVKIKLVSPKGYMQEGISDSKGDYFIKTFRGAGTITLSTETSAETQADKKYERFISLKDQFIFDLFDKDTITQNFFLKPMTDCRELPEIEFLLNSIKTATTLSFNNVVETAQEAIGFLKEIMVDNPSMVIEINGHCDIREKKELAIQRAYFVLNELVKNGIDKKRLVAIAFGSNKPLITENYIKAAKTIEEKEALYQKNRRVTCKVLRFNFKE